MASRAVDIQTATVGHIEFSGLKILCCRVHCVELVEKLNGYVGHTELVCPVDGCDFWLCMDSDCNAGSESSLRKEQYHKRPYAAELQRPGSLMVTSAKCRAEEPEIEARAPTEELLETEEETEDEEERPRMMGLDRFY